ncbi:MAG: resA 8 [Sphingobacteriales bacterium]|nr:resA 8 [Sphingobacteriales bacterium]
MFLSLLVNAQVKPITPGQPAPEFNLKNVDNKMVSFNDYPTAKGFIIVFTCNTCPYAQGYEQRIIKLNEKFQPLGYPVIAINPNDPKLSPGDSFEKMQERAKSKKYPFPYLFDQGQTATDLYGATKTPHIFLAQRTGKGITIEYTGGIDSDPEGTDLQKTNYLEEAVGALLSGKKPASTVTKAIGCTVRRGR